MYKIASDNIKHPVKLQDESAVDQLRSYIIRSRSGQYKQLKQAIAHPKK